MFRIGIALMVLAWVAVVIAYNAPGHASIRYWLFVTAHCLNAGGFVMAAIGDRMAHRPFSTTRLAYAIFAGVVFAIIGPVFMSAAASGIGR